MSINGEALAVFIVLCTAVTVLGFLAARWQRGDLNLLDEWGLAGRRFGTVVTWFLLGGDLYTAYTFIAVPAVVFGTGAYGLFAMAAFVLVLLVPFAYLLSVGALEWGPVRDVLDRLDARQAVIDHQA